MAEGREEFGMAWKERLVWDSSVKKHRKFANWAAKEVIQ